MTGLRALLKRAAERGLLTLDALRGDAPALQGRVLVLAYHNIVPRGDDPVGDRSLHLSQEEFGRQLDALAEVSEIVSLRDALDAPPRAHERPRAVITFDDAYTGSLTAGQEELERRGLPVTHFVPPGLLGGVTFWWDALAGRAELSSALRAVVLDRLAGRQAEAMARAESAGWSWTEMPEFARSATRELLAAVARRPGVTLGAHTWSHPNLARLKEPEVALELARPFAWLREHHPDAALPATSYPYGSSTERVRTAASAAGFAAAFRIDGGAWSRSDPLQNLPRFTVGAGISLDGFRLRLRGRLLG